jgi:hypothetical protein
MTMPVIEASGQSSWHTQYISLAFVGHHGTGDSWLAYTDIEHLHPTTKPSWDQEW